MLELPFVIVSGVAYFIIQIFAIAAFFAIRYHFRSFGIPDDAAGRKIPAIFGLGILAFMVGGGFLWFAIFL